MFSGRYDESIRQRERALALAPVMNGRPAPITCATCGCRLVAQRAQGPWTHFEGPNPERDARGCQVPCLELPHWLN